MILENDRLLIEIGTGRGARVEKFFDKLNEKEWVWKPAMIQNDPDRELGLNANFDSNWAGGWEEVFPNDAPTKIGKYDLSDHGEVWSKNWALTSESDPLRASYKISCDSYPVSLTKNYELAPDQSVLSIRYEVESKTEEEIPFILKLHPALRIEEGDTFQMPEASMGPVALEFSRILGKNKKSKFPVGENKEGKEVSINTALPRDNFSREFVKLSELGTGRCSLRNPRTNTELVFSFNERDFPYVWLFQSYGGFLDHYVAMIEPTNADHDDLSTSAKERTAAFLKPFEKKEFHMEIRLL